MNVISHTRPNGSIHHCNSRCYNSLHKRCTCLCHGLLHGKGKAIAIKNAAKAAMYLQLNRDTTGQYFPASDLIPDTGSR